MLSSEFPKVSLNWYSLAHWYTNKQDKGTFIQKALTGLEPRIKTFDGQSEIYKIMMIVFDQNELRQLQNQLNQLEIPNVAIQQSGQWYLEITSDKRTKANAVQSILNDEALDFTQIAAIGDGHNDISLLLQIGRSAFELAISKEIKQLAIKSEFILQR